MGLVRRHKISKKKKACGKILSFTSQENANENNDFFFSINIFAEINPKGGAGYGSMRGSWPSPGFHPRHHTHRRQ